MNYKNIIKHYEECFQQYGDTPKGIDWPNEKDMFKRYNVMLDLIKWRGIKSTNETILDFGCGTGNLYSHLQNNRELSDLIYTGTDASEKFIDFCKKKYENTTFIYGDILQSESMIENFDWIIANGVFTEKRELSDTQMWEYFKKLISKLFRYSRRGIAFNVMSEHVDWKRDDLFHLKHDKLCEYLTKNLTRNYIIRNDYGLYEYTIYLYKENLVDEQ